MRFKGAERSREERRGEDEDEDEDEETRLTYVLHTNNLWVQETEDNINEQNNNRMVCPLIFDSLYLTYLDIEYPKTKKHTHAHHTHTYTHIIIIVTLLVSSLCMMYE